jgi:hypothetical protein
MGSGNYRSGTITMSNLAAYQSQFELSPIILNGGLAGPTGVLSLTEIALNAGNGNSNSPFTVQNALGVAGNLLSGGGNINPYNASVTLANWILNKGNVVPFAHFSVITGGTLLNNQLGKYPYANQQIAANSIIVQPNNFSMLMKLPINQNNSLSSRLSIITGLTKMLDQHTTTGGTFTVLTPSYTYIGCVLLMLKDVSNSDDKKTQTAWQFDFEVPLTTYAAATKVLNNLTQTMQLGSSIAPPQISGSLSQVGVGTTYTPISTSNGQLVSNVTQQANYQTITNNAINNLR